VRRSSGFTIVEIIVVLLLMSILAATLIGRSITSSNLELNSATDKILNQIRYAQSQAMKRTNAVSGVWGIQSDGNNKYWMFRASPAVTEERIPGGDYEETETHITFKNLGKDIKLNSFTIVFDFLGRPYRAQELGVPNTPVTAANSLTISVSKGTEPPRNITITPETGFCVIQ
jgi:prepilin-type N-terminal cleavage/methylation domain-containing protein